MDTLTAVTSVQGNYAVSQNPIGFIMSTLLGPSQGKKTGPEGPVQTYFILRTLWLLEHHADTDGKCITVAVNAFNIIQVINTGL